MTSRRQIGFDTAIVFLCAALAACAPSAGGSTKPAVIDAGPSIATEADTPSEGAFTGSVALGTAGPVAVNAAGGYARVRPVDGAIRYEARLAFRAPEGRGGRALTVELDSFTRAGTFSAVRAQVTEYRDPAAEDSLGAILESRTCDVRLERGGVDGSLSCELLPPKLGGGVSPTPVEASWHADAVPDLRGAAIEVTWELGDHYVSRGRSIAWRDRSREEVPELYVVPDVRIAGDPSEPEILRIVIRGYAGDGTYTGDDVDPSLQHVRGDSPRIAAGSIVLAASDGKTAVSTEPRSELWAPIFGPCTAMIANGGSTGSISCAADPQHRTLPTAGSTTLIASWGPAPK